MKSKIRLLLVCICMLAAGICYLTAGHRRDGARIISSAVSEEKETFESRPAGEETKETAAPAAVDLPAEAPAEKIVVHVCGEVASPGVYELPAGSRVYQAVEMAGGYTDGAASDFLNMAQVLCDGMKLEIPDEEQALKLSQQAESSAAAGTFSGGAAGPASGKVNINTASKEELETLKGIGEARAEDIISYRQEHGPFSKIEDIMKVSGIKEAAFLKIKENITV